MKSIGERIRMKREERGFSQSELARRMQAAGWPNYYQVTVSRTEQNARSVRLDEAVTLARVLGLNLDWLARGEDDHATNHHADGYRAGIDAARHALDSL